MASEVAWEMQAFIPAGRDVEQMFPDGPYPLPVSPLTPSHGLIGCFSADELSVVAIAWEPYQHLFQGIVVCLHADPALDGLDPGETKHLRGKLYVTNSDVDRLLERYENDFPEHRNRSTAL